MSYRHLATPEDPNAYMGIVMAVQNLLMRQALSLEQAWTILLQREHGPDTMPDSDTEKTRELLREFNYREYAVTPISGGEAKPLWIRPDWPRDRIEWVPFD